MKLVKLATFAVLMGSAALPAAARSADGRLKVVTTFTVIADMARNVAGDKAEVISITKPGAEIHGYQPTPQDLVSASDADLILWNGLNLELWFEQFIANLGDIPSETVTDGIEPMSISIGPYTGKANPHAWMGLNSAVIYINNIRDALGKYDPDNADAYAANAAAYVEKLRATVGPLRDRITQIPADDRWLTTCEGAFSYLARDFGMKELFLWPINADQIGTPAAGARGDRRGQGTSDPRRVLRKHRQQRAGKSRSRAKPARTTAGCSMSTASASPTGRCRPIWICCASRRKPLPTGWMAVEADARTQCRMIEQGKHQMRPMATTDR